jgi:hypothetical protein
MSENKNPEILQHMKNQLEAYGKVLAELADILGVAPDAPVKGEKEKAVGTAEVKKHWELTDGNPED